MALPSQVAVPITVSLREETLKAFQAQIVDIPIGDWLSNKCRLWLENFANGGLMLNPDQIKRIEEAAGKPVANGNDVVSAIGKTNGNEDGQRSFLLTLDPTFVQPLANRAAEMGRTPSDLINDMFSFALDNNWVYSLDATYQPPVYFPNYKAIQTLTGMDRPTGADIEKAIGELVKLAKAGKAAMLAEQTA